MQINDELISYLEELSRLRLSEKEKENAKKDLEKILNYINKLDEINTDKIEDMSHPFNFTNNLRDDEVKASTDKEIILKNASVKKEGCFKVPKTVE